MYARFIESSDVAVRSVAYTRTVKRERHRPVGQYGEFAFEERKRGALFHPGRQNTDALQTLVRTQADVVGTSVAGSDAQSGAAPYAAVVGSATGNGTIYLVVVEELGRPAALRSSPPGGNGHDNPVASDSWCTEAAIEEHGIRSSHALVCRRTAHGLSGLRQKCG